MTHFLPYNLDHTHRINNQQSRMIHDTIGQGYLPTEIF